jgi:DNA-binding transcriptional LysR family regulator
MRRMDLLTHLRGFVTVADEMSVSAAADVLDMDQPLLSRRIRALEAYLDTQLLDRSRRRIELTEAALELLPRARLLLAQSEHLIDSARSRPSSHFVLHLPPDPEPAGLSRLIEFLAGCQIDWRLHVGVRQGVSADGWVIEPCEFDTMVWRVPLGVGSSPSISRLPSPVHLADLRPERGRPCRTLLLTEADLPWYAGFSRAADRAGIPPSHAEVGVDPSVAVAQVLSGHSRLMCSAAQARRSGLSWVPFADESIARRYRLAERRPAPARMATPPARQQLHEVLAEVLGAT